MHDRRQSVLRAGLDFVGERLSSQSEPKLEHLELSRSPDQVVDPNGVLQGATYRYQGALDMSRFVPNLGEAPFVFTVQIGAVLGSLQSLSNAVTVSLLPRNYRDEAFGGLLYPTSGAQIHSDFLLVDAWAVRCGDEVSDASVYLDDRMLGAVQVNLHSPRQAKSLSGVSEAKNCRLSCVLDRDALIAGGISDRQLCAGVMLSVECRFKSGALLKISGGRLNWYAQVRPVVALQAQDESVRITDSNKMEIQGSLINRGFSPVKFSLEGARSRLGSEEVGELSWSRRERLVQSFPAQDNGGGNTFSWTIDPGVFERNPGALSLYAETEDGTERVKLSSVGFETQIRALIAGWYPLGTPKEVFRNLALSLLWRLKSDGIVGGRQPTSDAAEQRLIVATHNLCEMEGAPKVLYRVLAALSTAGTRRQILVISPRAGGLQDAIEQLGIEVRIVPELDMVGIDCPRYFEGLEKSCQIAREFSANAVYANVIDSFWGIDLASRLDVPSVWALHESIDPRSWYPNVEPRLRLAFLHSLKEAKKFIFVSRSTAEMFEPVITEGSVEVIPNGVDIAEVDALRKAISKDDARAKLGIDSSDFVVSIIGTSAARKGQDIFLREMALLRDKRHDSRLLFQLVGMRESPFAEELRAQARELGFSERQLRFVEETPEVARYFIASDVVVICSRQESAPLVSLEAFAYQVPLISTKVFGLAEQIRDCENALSFSIENRGELASRVERLMDDPELRQQLVVAAREDVEARFSLDSSMQQYLEALARLC